MYKMTINRVSEETEKYMCDDYDIDDDKYVLLNMSEDVWLRIAHDTILDIKCEYIEDIPSD